MSAPKKTRKHSNGDKVRAILREKALGISESILQSRYNISSSAYYRIIHKDPTSLKPNQKRAQKSKYDSINFEVHKAYQQLRDHGFPVSGPAIKFLAENARTIRIS